MNSSFKFKKTAGFKMALVLITSSLSINLYAQNSTSDKSVVCTEKIINGQTVMRCIKGDTPTYRRPTTPTINPPTITVPIVNPPSLPPLPNPNPPNPPMPTDPIDYTGPNPHVPQPGTAMCERAGFPPSPGPGPGPCGSVEIDPTECSVGMTGPNRIIKAWQFNLEGGLSLRKGNNIRFGMQPNHAIVFRFNTGPINPVPGSNPPHLPLSLGFDEYIPNGGIVPKFFALSEKRCDFDYSKMYDPQTMTGLHQVPADSFCYISAALGSLQSRIYLNPPTAKDIPYCPLKPNTTYYLSMRFEDARPTTIRPDGVVLSNGRGIISCHTDWLGPAGTCGQTLLFN